MLDLLDDLNGSQARMNQAPTKMTDADLAGNDLVLREINAWRFPSCAVAAELDRAAPIVAATLRALHNERLKKQGISKPPAPG